MRHGERLRYCMLQSISQAITRATPSTAAGGMGPGTGTDVMLCRSGRVARARQATDGRVLATGQAAQGRALLLWIMKLKISFKGAKESAEVAIGKDLGRSIRINHERVCGNVERIQCKKFGCGKWLPKSRALEQHKEDEWCPMIHLIRTYEEDNKNPPLSIQMPLDSVINLVLGSDQKRVQQLKELMQYIFHRIDASGLAIANKGLICVPVSDEHQAHDETRPESHSTLGEDVWCEYAALQARFSFIAQSRDVVMHSSLSSAEKRLLLDGINQELQGIVEVIGLLLSRCQKLEARILDLECSHSGVFLWKIDNYSQRKKNAATTNVKSIYSMPFFTSQYGYKLCGGVFLMGDGVGKETHISLFLTIMRGPHDAVLPWPFKQKIIFQLVNQDDPLNKSIVEAFRPDPTSSSFKRPTSDRNIGAGCPLFAKIQLVEDPNQGFLKDDTLHLKIISQTSDVLELK
ncbi:uncharacterized protein [Diadema antillarum]|uniref:uncharacterized protein n=1 Tax=Diadema antillarum TaxID=105358 RepID=UPI003A8621DF